MDATTSRRAITETVAAPRPGRIVLLVVLTITCGLWVDRAGGVAGQIIVTFTVWGVLTWLCLWLPRAL